MEIKFTRLANPDKYSITRNGGVIFIAAYNRKEDTRELYSPDLVKISEAFCHHSKWFQLVPDYSIQLFMKDNCEVLIKPQSVVRQTYSFDFDERRYFVIRHTGCKYSIFREGKRVAVHQACGPGSEDQNTLVIFDNGLCLELFCLLALYLHSDMDLILPRQTRHLM